jgi:hypothetical protein
MYPAGTEPWIDLDGEVDEALRRVFLEARMHINQVHKSGKLVDVYQFRVAGYLPNFELNDLANSVLMQQEHAVKFNFSLGCILKHKISGEYYH